MIGRLKELGSKERELQATILLYLAEIDRRRLYLPLGYGSLFDLCTSSLGYTRATAARRIASARAAARFPLALDLLLTGEINITTLSIASRILDEENYREVLTAIRRKSTREVDMLVSSRSPVPMPRDSVRPLCVMRRAPESEGSGAASLNGRGPAASKVSQRDRGEGGLEGTEHRPHSTPSAGTGECSRSKPDADTEHRLHSTLSAETGHRPKSTLSAGTWNSSGAETEHRPDSTLSAGTGQGRVVLERRLRISFTVDPAFMEKLERARSLLSGRHPAGMSFEDLFDALIEEYLERHAPERRNSRRRSRAGSQYKGHRRSHVGSQDKNRDRSREKPGNAEVSGGLERTSERTPPGASHGPAPGPATRPAPGVAPCSKVGSSHGACGSAGISNPRSRHIPASVRDRVYERDGGRCTFAGSDGRRCGSTWDLEIDHIVPRALGGDDSPANLRLLCRRHNMLEAERRLGPELMAGRIDADRRRLQE